MECYFSRSKGHLISKANCQAEILPKTEQKNSFLLVCDVFLFVFWKNPRPEKNVLRLSDLYQQITKSAPYNRILNSLGLN